MLQIHSDPKELLASFNDLQQQATPENYQTAYLRFRGLLVDEAEQDEIYQQWAQEYPVDVDNESGEVVKLHESLAELCTDVKAFISFIEQKEQTISSFS